LEVIRGNGDGSYTTGEVVTITADEAGEGEKFDQWISSDENTQIEDPSSPTTRIAMPGNDVQVTATYIGGTQFNLEVIRGNGDGSYTTGEVVTITADEAGEGEKFDQWISSSFNTQIEDPSSPTTRIGMPRNDVQVTATYNAAIDYELTVTDGGGSGRYTAGERVVVDADDIDFFVRWTIVSGNPTLRSIDSSQTVLTMPAEDVEIQATIGLCGVSYQERGELLLNQFREVSGDAPLQSVSTAQFQAANWLINEDELTICPEDEKVIQRYILAIFYFSTLGDNWTECSRNDSTCGSLANDFEGQSPYLSGSSECEWAGSSCDEEKCIISIIFEEGNNVSGTLPQELGDLEGLEIISLETQQLGGRIPASLSNAKSLRIIDFDFNSLTGAIPEEIFTISTLEQLDLNNNQLTGTMSNSISQMTSLIFIQLHFNGFSGTIPEGIAAIPLLVAEFQGNQFTGDMPLCIGEPGQTVGALSTDCGLESGELVTCGDNCGCECF